MANLLRPLTGALTRPLVAGFPHAPTKGVGVAVPRILLSSLSIDEDAEVGDLIGTLSVENLPDGVTVTGYSITADPDSKFQLDGGDDTQFEVGAALDYETKTAHSVTFEATLSAGDPLTRTFSISVGDVPVAAPDRYTGSDWSVADLTTGNAIRATITGTVAMNAEGGSQTDIEVKIGSTIYSSLLTGPGDIDITDADELPNDTLASVQIRPVKDGYTWPTTGTDEEQGWSDAKTVTPTEGAAVPENSVAPVISGNKQVGQTLSMSDGTWTGSPSSIAKQWTRNGSDISGATSDDYTLVEADAGQVVSGYAVATNGAGDSDPADANSLTIDVYLVYLTHIEDTSDLTTYNGAPWQGISFGVDAPNRQIVLGVSARDSSFASGGLSSGSIGGSPVSIEHSVLTTSAGGQNCAEIVVAAPTGTSGNISLSYAAAKNRAGAGVWAVYGADGATPHDLAQQVADNTNDTLAIPAGGVAIGCCVNNASADVTWTGLTERYDAPIEVRHSGADTSSVAGEAGLSVGVDANATPTIVTAAFASWGPA